MAEALNVLTRDRFFAVCAKPPGVLSEAGKPGSLPDLLGAFLRAQGEQPDVFVVHRLDREAGGLTVLARTPWSAAKLTAAINEGAFEKEYLAVLRGKPEQTEAELEDLLFHDSRVNKTYVVKRPRVGVRPAKLAYRVLAEAEENGKPLTLVRVRLYTGRTHQIRAQFSSRGLPLWGDARYGGGGGGLALWSCFLSFPHPRTGYRTRFFLPPPDTAPWNGFPVDCLREPNPLRAAAELSER